MKNEFIPYELSLELKQIGFDEPCFGDYYKFDNNDIHLDTDDDRHRIITDNKDEVIIEISAPLFQQAFRYFREKYNLWGMIYPRDGWNYSIQRVDETTSCTGESFHGVEIKSYEEAELECLKKLIQIVKNGKS